MTQSEEFLPPHVTKEAVLRFVDDESDDDERRVVSAHIATCADCLAVQRRLAGTTETLSALLTKAHTTVHPSWRPPAGRRTAGRWRFALAASLGTLLIAGAIAPPVRAWLVDRIAALAPASAPPAVTDAARSPDDTGTTPLAGSRVHFAPTGSHFVIALTNGATGRLTIRSTGDVLAAATLTGGGPEAEILVMEAGFRVRIEPDNAVELRIDVPVSITTVEVRLAGRSPTILSAPDVGAAEGIIIALDGAR